MNTSLAKSYVRLIKAGRRTVADIPAEMIAAVKLLAPELFDMEVSA